jgi:hypothetical protein
MNINTLVTLSYSDIRLDVGSIISLPLTHLLAILAPQTPRNQKMVQYPSGWQGSLDLTKKINGHPSLSVTNEARWLLTRRNTQYVESANRW